MKGTIAQATTYTPMYVHGAWQVTVALSATAGNRGNDFDEDESFWDVFFTKMKSTEGGVQCRFVKFEGTDYAQGGSGTISGTQEALFEAMTVTSKFNAEGETDEYVGFFSSGGASAQFGLKLCTADLAQKWGRILSDKDLQRSVTESQCSQGTESAKTDWMSWSTKDNIDRLSGADLKSPVAGSCSSTEECWALGSLMSCPGLGFVKGAAAGTSDGVGDGQRPWGACSKRCLLRSRS